MFIEPNLSGDRRGWIEVICGSMFSGKTEELIRRLKRVSIANQKVEIFKPGMDIRYDIRNIISHAYDSLDNEKLWSILINHIPQLKVEINDLIEKYDIYLGYKK